MKSLDLTKAKAGQTIYYINDNMPCSKPFEMWIEKVMVTNDPIPPEGEMFIWGGKVSRHSLALIAAIAESNRVPYIKATHKQAEIAMKDAMQFLKKHCKPEPIKPEEGGKCPLGCEDSKLEYQMPGNCTCHNFAPCSRCENAVLECNQCGNEFVEE